MQPSHATIMKILTGTTISWFGAMRSLQHLDWEAISQRESIQQEVTWK